MISEDPFLLKRYPKGNQSPERPLFIGDVTPKNTKLYRRGRPTPVSTETGIIRVSRDREVEHNARCSTLRQYTCRVGVVDHRN